MREALPAPARAVYIRDRLEDLSGLLVENEMRAEFQALADQTKQSLELLRRHL